MGQMLKILLLEDSQDDAGLITRAMLKGGLEFEEKRVDTRTEFADAIRHFAPDVILSDHALPQFNSLEALKICKRLGLSVPFILVTGTVSEEFAVMCLKQGADDYVLKSNLSRLPIAIQSALNNKTQQAQRKRAEEELRRQNEELAKVNMEMDRFVYSVSHNLRAPLMSVLGLLDLASREDKERESYFQKYFGMMTHSINRLDETLHEILDYSRNARNETEYKKIDFKDLIEDCLGRLQYLDGFSRIEKNIVANTDQDFYSDESRLLIIFNNLFSNVVKYRDEEKPVCHLNVTATIRQDTTTILVEDNGIGIENHLQSRIFDMFFRGTTKSDGAGLGLYIVKEVVNKLQGTVQAESELAFYTRIRLELPNNIPAPAV